jgi:hypothetical protein
MNSKRTYYLMLGLIGLLVIGLLAGAYETNTLLGSQAVSLTMLKAKTKALDKEQVNLKTAKQQIAANSDFNGVAASIVPQDKDQAEAVRESVSIASKNGISLGSITFPASTLGNSTASGPTAASGTGATAKPFTNPGTATNSALSQLLPVKNIPGVYDLQITVAGDPHSAVPYAEFVSFLADLEHNRRTAQVSAITLTPDLKDPSALTFSLTLDEYIKP